MGNNKPLQAHLSLLSAEIFWGLLAPIGKDAMLHGVDNITLVSFRVTGAALLFWIASLFIKERMPWRHVLFMAGAALLGVVFNQCLYTFGLSYTSPVNASILILSSAHSGGKTGNIWGDLMCMGAQLSFALYLTIYNPLIRRYNVVTVNKWMFTWSCVFILPFSGSHVALLPVDAIAAKTWAEVFYVVVFGTFLSYLLAVVGQRILRPTVVSVYNYVQPVVSVIVSVLTGLSIFTVPQGIAVIFIFSGVWLVIKSKSKRDMETQKK